MAAKGIQITALLIAPNRTLADQFAASVARTRAFNIIGDLRSYPTSQQLDARIRQTRPDLLLLDVATDFDTAGELIKFATSLNPPVHVVGLHTQNDSDAILRSLRFGASEFLFAPFEVSVQEAAIARIQRLLGSSAASDLSNGRIVVFTSAKPGSGSTTLSVQTAYALRRASGRRVLLGDFDLMSGDIGFMLNLDHGYSLVDALQHADRLDDFDLWSTLTADADGIDVLPAPELAYTEHAEPSRLKEFYKHIRATYEWSVLDLPNVFNRLSLMCISEADRVFIVSTSELASLHLARKAVKTVMHFGVDAQKVQVLINRMDKRQDLNSSDLNKIFECQVDTSLPNDQLSLQRVVTAGQSLDAESELGRAIDGLAGKLMGAVPENKRTHSFHLRPLLSHT